MKNSILKLKKVGKTTRSFRYDLNLIPNDYTVEVTNRFRGLYLIERVPEELWTEVHNIVQEEMINTFKECDLIECLKNYRQKFIHCTGGHDQNYP